MTLARGPEEVASARETQRGRSVPGETVQRLALTCSPAQASGDSSTGDLYFQVKPHLCLRRLGCRQDSASPHNRCTRTTCIPPDEETKPREHPTEWTHRSGPSVSQASSRTGLPDLLSSQQQPQEKNPRVLEHPEECVPERPPQLSSQQERVAANSMDTSKRRHYLLWLPPEPSPEPPCSPALGCRCPNPTGMLDPHGGEHFLS